MIKPKNVPIAFGLKLNFVDEDGGFLSQEVLVRPNYEDMPLPKDASEDDVKAMVQLLQEEIDEVTENTAEIVAMWAIYDVS